MDGPNDLKSECVLSHQANGHAARIENVKPMFVEPKGKGTFTEVSVVSLNVQVRECDASICSQRFTSWSWCEPETFP